MQTEGIGNAKMRAGSMLEGSRNCRRQCDFRGGNEGKRKEKVRDGAGLGRGMDT